MSPAVFRNEDALSPEFQPPELPGRERELQALAGTLAPLAQGRKSGHALLVGGTGTGKTSVAKRALAELAERERVAAAYVNAWQHDSRLAVWSQVALALELPLQRRGIAPDEFLQRVAEFLKNAKRGLAVVVDEVDALAERDARVLYELTRLEELHGVRASVVGITNRTDFLALLEPRIRSSFAPTVIPFSTYSPLTLKKILDERAKIALAPNALDKEALALCAAYAAKRHGDARVALDLLFKAARAAEKKGTVVTSERVRDAIAALEARADVRAAWSPVSLEQKIGSLSEGERRAVKILQKAGGVLTSRGLYDAFARDSGEHERTVRDYVKGLEDKGLVKTTLLVSGAGNTRRIELRT